MSELPVQIQHTKCMTVITVATVVLKFLTTEEQKRLGIESLVKDCRDNLVKYSNAFPPRKTSAGARREMERVFSVFMSASEKLSHEDSYRQNLGAMLWAAASLLDDAYQQCTLYKNVPGWLGIWTTLNAIVGAFEERIDGVSDIGYELYQEAV